MLKQCCVTIMQDEKWSGNLARSFSLLLSQINIHSHVELRLEFQSFFKGSEVSRSEFSRSEVSRSQFSRNLLNQSSWTCLCCNVQGHPYVDPQRNNGQNYT